MWSKDVEKTLSGRDANLMVLTRHTECTSIMTYKSSLTKNPNISLKSDVIDTSLQGTKFNDNV